MAKHLQVTPGTGPYCATDECTVEGSTVQVPRGKLGWGAIGSYVDVSATDPLPVALAATTVRVDPTGTTTQPVSLVSLPALAAGSAVIGHVIVDAAPSTAVTNAGTFAVQVSNTVTITGTVGVSGSVEIANDAGNPIPVSGSVTLAPATTGGATPTCYISAATTNATSVKGSAGQVLTIEAFNNNASSWRYLKLYDKATAPTVGTDTPVKVAALPPGGGAVTCRVVGAQFTLGIAFAITGGPAHSDTTAVALNEVIVNLETK